MKPSDAIALLIQHAWTETRIADAIGTSQPTINRIKKGAKPSFDVGHALIELAKRSKPTPKRKPSGKREAA